MNTQIKLYDLKWEDGSWLQAVNALTVNTKYLKLHSNDIDNNDVTAEALKDYLETQYSNQLVEWSWQIEA